MLIHERRMKYLPARMYVIECKQLENVKRTKFWFICNEV